MAVQTYAKGDFARAICDRCGWEWPFKELRFEPFSSIGVASNKPTNLKVCPDCWDPPHPQSWLPLAVAAHGSDPEQLRDPRPDVFPIAYPVAFQPSSIVRGVQTPLSAVGVFAGYSATSSGDVVLIVTSGTQLLSPQRVMLSVLADISLPAGNYTITITDGQGNNLKGPITLT